MWRRITLMIASGPLAIPAVAMPQFSQAVEPPAQYELGVDVIRVTRTPETVRVFLSSLSPDQQDSVMRKCQYFMDNPESAKGMETMVFCSIATQAGSHAIL